MTIDIVDAPISGPSVWTGADLARTTDWIRTFRSEEIADLDRALARWHDTSVSWSEITRDEHPLPAVAPLLDDVARELDRGRGFVLLRGLPVDRWSEAECEAAYWMLGLHLGTPVSQNAQGDILGHVRDTGADPADPSVRLYRTSERLGFHSDGADIIGLLCLRTARSGGESLLASAPQVYNEVARRRPDLLPLLYEPVPFDRNEEQRDGEPPYFMFPICHRSGNRLSTFYIGWYIRDSQRHRGAPRLRAEQVELLDLVDEIADEPNVSLAMDLEPGDVQLVKNAAILHSRTRFDDHDDPSRRRHLLRLWLAAHTGFDDGNDILRLGIRAKDPAAGAEGAESGNEPSVERAGYPGRQRGKRLSGAGAEGAESGN